MGLGEKVIFWLNNVRIWPYDKTNVSRASYGNGW